MRLAVFRSRPRNRPNFLTRLEVEFVPAQAKALVRDSRGNPLHLCELIRGLASELDAERGLELDLDGLIAGRVSARTALAGSAFYTWESTRPLVQDVQLWISAPRRNFGWILIGDETAPQSAKRFASRESSDPLLRPLLEVTYSEP